MILRKAELRDYESYKKLFEDDNDDIYYQWLYVDTTPKDISEEEAEAFMQKYFGDLSEFTKYFRNYTIERYKEEIAKSYNFIYMIEEGDEILGYISMHLCSKGVYKIAEWAMFDAENLELRNRAWELLLKLKLPRLQGFEICTCSTSTENWLISKGFESSKLKSFYRFMVKKKKAG